MIDPVDGDRPGMARGSATDALREAGDRVSSVRRAERHAVLADLRRRALHERDPQALMDAAARGLRDALSVDLTGVHELDADGRSLLLRAGRGWQPDAVGRARIPVVEGSAGAAIVPGRLGAGIEAVARDTFSGSVLLRTHRVVGGVSVVIPGRASPFGMLGVYTATPRAFTEEDCGFLQEVAELVGAAATRERDQRAHACAERSHHVAAVGQMASVIAGELDGLLGVIAGSTRRASQAAAQRREPGPELESIARAAERAGDLVRELIVAGGREALPGDPTDLNELVRDELGILRTIAGESVVLIGELSDALWRMAPSRGELERMLEQLTRDARAAMPAGGVLAISTDNVALDDAAAAEQDGAPAGRFVRLTVADTGSERGARSARGLGDALVRTAARQFGGFARTHAEPERGRAVRLYLPAVAPGAPAAPPAAGHGETALVLLEQPAAAARTRGILSGNGYAVSPAGGADAATAALERGEPAAELLVIDAERAGDELVARLRADRPELALILVSALPASILPPARQGPRTAVLDAPFDTAALLRSARHVLG